MLVNGDHRVALFAQKNLSEGEELLYDYRCVPKINKLLCARNVYMVPSLHACARGRTLSCRFRKEELSNNN